MYKSPIELIMDSSPVLQIRQDFEGLVAKALLNFGVNIDKDELIKLLEGDRDSYNQGYKDGYDAAIAKIMEALEQ